MGEAVISLVPGPWPRSPLGFALGRGYLEDVTFIGKVISEFVTFPNLQGFSDGAWRD